MYRRCVRPSLRVLHVSVLDRLTFSSCTRSRIYFSFLRARGSSMSSGEAAGDTQAGRRVRVPR